jgi:hypothetical protein
MAARQRLAHDHAAQVFAVFTPFKGRQIRCVDHRIGRRHAGAAGHWSVRHRNGQSDHCQPANQPDRHVGRRQCITPEQGSSSSVSPTVTEAEVNSVLSGAAKEGAGISLNTKGKVIISSLEMNSTNNQYICGNAVPAA